MEEQNYLFKNQSHHLANLNNIRLSGNLCDVTIKVNDREFQANKIILAATFRYFESMFLKPFQESKQDVITMKDMDETDLEAFLSYAYTGEILITASNALNLLAVANYLVEDNIKEACIDFLILHLQREEACRAYQLANAIGSSSLKCTAKQTILSNFGECSLTTEYLELDFESLKDILSCTSPRIVDMQQTIFEGTVRWIAYDPKNRRFHVNDLLDLIEITKLKPDFLLQYFCNSIGDQSCGDIVKDIMLLYQTKFQDVCQTENSRQSLIITSVGIKKLFVQFYDFIEKRWSLPRQIIDFEMYEWSGQLAILNNICYHTVGGISNLDKNTKTYLQIFNPAMKQHMSLAFDSRLLRNSAVCTCSRFIYLGGGSNGQNFSSASDQILKYDPQANSFEALPSMSEKRLGASAVFYQGYLHVLGGYNGSSRLNSVEKYDPDTNEWISLPSMCEERWFFGVAVLDGKLYASGNMDSKSVEVYNPATNSWQLLATMNKPRSIFPVIAYKGKLLVIGGNDERSAEVYDPIKNQWQMDDDLSSELKLAVTRGGLISSSCIGDANKSV